MNQVFLSASFPVSSRDDESGEHSSPDIGLAASAVIEAVLRRGGHLVFGGHPSISPLALNIALLRPESGRVTVYQSEYFRDQVTAEVERLQGEAKATVIWIRAGEGRSGSLKLMRSEMLARHFDAAFFVGGMSGIDVEARLVTEGNPECQRFFFTRPGGRAAMLASRLREGRVAPGAPPAVEELGQSLIALNHRGYALLAMAALDRIANVSED